MSESVLITSCEPYISNGVVKLFLEHLLLVVVSGNLWSPMIFVILRLILFIAAPCFGSETQSFAVSGVAHLQSMFTPVPLWACCLLSCLSVDTFPSFFLSTTVKSVKAKKNENRQKCMENYAWTQSTLSLN